MDIKVLEVEDQPAHTFLSIRYGETRKQGPCRANETFTFPAGQQPKAFTVDVLRKVASTQVSLAGITAVGGSLNNVEIQSLDIGDAPMKASFAASWRSMEPEEKTAASRGRNAAERARQYMESSGIQPFLQEMFTQLLERKPRDYLDFMADFIEQKREEVEHLDAGDIDFSSEPGLGDEALPGFVDFPLPDISKHNSLAMAVLRSPELSDALPRLATLRTSMDVTLARCIKAAVDCPGHPLVKVAGAYAGDAESYEVFKEFFDPLIAAMNPGYPKQGRPSAAGPVPLDSDLSKISDDAVDSSGCYVVFTSLEARRNVTGFKMPMCCSQTERRDVERIVSNAKLRGTYLPLRSSKSCPALPIGMAAYQEERLRKVGMLLTEPDSKIKLAAGFGRHWPDARGVFVCDSPGTYIWVNEEDHFRFFARQEGCELKHLYERLVKAMNSVADATQTVDGERCGFASSPRHGWVTSDPSRLGAALRVTMTLRIPRLANAVDVVSLCQSLNLECDSSTSAISGNLWQIHSSAAVGLTEVELMNSWIKACSLLVNLEQRLEKGQSMFEVLPGMGLDYPGQLPLLGACPEEMPDISSCCSLVATCLRSSPELYAAHRSLSTSTGIGLGPCLRPGVDREAGKQRTASGLVAGDEECLETFRPLFLCIHEQLENVVPELPTFSHDNSEMPCKWVKVEMRRNLAGARFAPSCSKEERRKVERLLVSCLQTQEVVATKGQYYPLAFSTSYAPMPNGMDPQEERTLVELGQVFGFPHSPAELSAGIGRDWPDARGAFILEGAESDGQTVLWINQADHLRLRCFVAGGQMELAYDALQGLADRIEKAVKDSQGTGFARHTDFGYLTTDSLHMGAGVQFTAAVPLRHLHSRPEFRPLCALLNLVESYRDGCTELSSYPAPNLSSEELLRQTLQSLCFLVSLEKKLVDDVAIEEDLQALGII